MYDRLTVATELSARSIKESIADDPEIKNLT